MLRRLFLCLSLSFCGLQPLIAMEKDKQEASFPSVIRKVREIHKQGMTVQQYFETKSDEEYSKKIDALVAAFHITPKTWLLLKKEYDEIKQNDTLFSPQKNPGLLNSEDEASSAGFSGVPGMENDTSPYSKYKKVIYEEMHALKLNTACQHLKINFNPMQEHEGSAIIKYINSTPSHLLDFNPFAFRIMSEDQSRALISHELCHLKNYEVLLEQLIVATASKSKSCDISKMEKHPALIGFRHCFEKGADLYSIAGNYQRALRAKSLFNDYFRPMEKIEKGTFEEGDDEHPSHKERLELVEYYLKHLEAQELINSKVLFCELCGLKGTEQKPLQVCSACKNIRYCSRECQAKSWQEHKKECKK